MDRVLKQFGFGLFFLVILGLVTGGIYYFYFGSAATCFDNKKNQGEIEMDCGGPCLPCEIKGLNLEVQTVKSLAAGSKQVTLLARMRNPSANYGARFSYQFEVEVKPDRVMEFKDKTTIAPQATKYIVLPGVFLQPADIRMTSFKVTELNWITEIDNEPVYLIELENKTNLVGDGVTVTGSLKNNSPLALASVRLIAILFNQEGTIFQASATELNRVSAFSERPFTIFFPGIKELKDRLDSERTQVFWEVQ